jgi:hypothetical protein
VKNVQTAKEMLELSTRADMGYGWVVIMALCLCLTYTGFRYAIPGISRLTIPFPAQLAASKNSALWPWLIGLVGVTLRIPHLFENLWYDETFTAAFARLPLENLPAAIMGDVHPPLPYLLSWLINHLFGGSEVILRLPSFGFGLLMIYLVYRLAGALGRTRNTALVAAALVAAMPGAIYYSDEARGYAWLACMALGAAICILENRPRLFVLCAGSIPWLHNTGYIYLGLFILMAMLYRPNRRWLQSATLAGLIGAIWLPFMLQQSTDISNGFWIPPLTLPGSLWYVMANTAGVNMPDLFVLPVFLPLWAVTLFAIWHSKRWLLTRRGLLYLGLCFGAPALLSLVSWLWRPVYVSRALLPSGVALAILWAIYITNRGKNAWWLTGAALGLSVVGFYSPVAAKTPVEGYLKSCSGADMAYYTDVVAWFYGNYYVDAPSLVWEGANDLNQSLPDTAKAVLFNQGNETNLRGKVCLIEVDTPYSTADERSHVANVVSRYPHETHYQRINGVFDLYIYLLDIT